jgi:hypothetical protein
VGVYSSQSQSATSKKAKRGPRAIAVVEFLPNGNLRLVPVLLSQSRDPGMSDRHIHGHNAEAGEWQLGGRRHMAAGIAYLSQVPDAFGRRGTRRQRNTHSTE